MGNNVDFLTPGINHIRKSIRGIDDSYNNEWDILAEILQNAVDAIRKNGAKYNQIQIIIDAVKKEITVIDNGTGILIEKLPDLLKPFSTDKDNDTSTVGEKGVGLTFVIFSSEYFEIITGNGEKAVKATIEDALAWKNSTNDKELKLKIEPIEDGFLGTQVTLKRVVDSPIFSLNFEQLKYVLRTRTIIGNTKGIWENDINIDISLKFKDQNGEEKEEDIPFRYLLLPETLEKHQKISLDYFKAKYSEDMKTDAEKRRALFGKVIYHQGEYTHSSNRKIKYYAYFLPGRAMWDEFSKSWALLTDEKIDDEDYYSNFHYALLRPGIFTSVKGMPTGISINSPKSGSDGYWNNLFIIFEDVSLKFDVGRKALHGQQSLILQKYAKEIFNLFLKYVRSYVSRDSGVENKEWDRDMEFAKIEKLVSIDNDNTLFLKSPKGQEAQVCAMFYELAAMGIIKGLKFLTSGYKGRYDLYALWDSKKVVIEFKSELKKIFRDFNDEQKLFDEIDCIVCWDVSEEDKRVLQEKSITINEISNNPILGKRSTFPSATHELHIGGIVKPIYIIDLKKIIN